MAKSEILDSVKYQQGCEVAKDFVHCWLKNFNYKTERNLSA